METNKKGKTTGWACDLIPKPLIVARYFAAEQQALEAAATALDTASSALEALEEEHGGEDMAFAGFDKVNAAQVKDRLREIGKDKDAAEERDVLKAWLKHAEDVAELKKQLKTLDAELDAKAFAQYPQLSVDEIQTLVVDDKWLAALSAAVHGLSLIHT